MSKNPVSSFKPILDPYSRISEALFGLIMVLTFTGAISVEHAGRAEVRTMLISALGCNIAWGIIDAVLYLMNCFADRGSRLLTLKAVRKAATPQKAQALIASALPPLVASVLQPAEFEQIRERLSQLPEPLPNARLNGRDYIGALGVFLLVFLSTFPVALPFIFMNSLVWSLRVSRLIAILMLFLFGCALGRCAGRHPWLIGSLMVIIGIVLVAIAMALGG